MTRVKPVMITGDHSVEVIVGRCCRAITAVFKSVGGDAVRSWMTSKDVRLTVVILQHGENESAQTGPRAAAVLLGLPAGVRASAAGCR